MEQIAMATDHVSRWIGGSRAVCFGAIAVFIFACCGCEDRYQQGWNDGYSSGHSRGYREGYLSGTGQIIGDNLLPCLGIVVVAIITIIVAAAITTYSWKPVVRGLQQRHEHLEMIRVHELSLAEVYRRDAAAKAMAEHRIKAVDARAEAIGRRLTDDERMLADFRQAIRQLGVRCMERSCCSRDLERESAVQLLEDIRDSKALTPAEKTASMRGLLRRKKPTQVREPRR
jgi:hypothetical protein